MSTEIVKAEDFGLEAKTGTELTAGLAVTREEKKELIKSYSEVIKLDVEGNGAIFKALRLKIRDNRTKGTDVWHTKQKAVFLYGGKFVDAIKNADNEINLSMEAKLLEGEKYEENKEKERIENIRLERTAELEVYELDQLPQGLGEMSKDAYSAILLGYKTIRETQLAEAKKIEDARIENERLDNQETKRRIELAPYTQFLTGNADLRAMDDKNYSELLTAVQVAKVDYDKEQEEIRKQNAKLQKEASEKAAKDESERKQREEQQAKIDAANEAKLKAEQEAKQELQNQIDAANKAKMDATIQAEKEKQDLLKKGDKGQFDLCIENLNKANNFSNLKSAKYIKKAEQVGELINKVIDFINK